MMGTQRVNAILLLVVWYSWLCERVVASRCGAHLVMIKACDIGARSSRRRLREKE